MGSEYRVGIDSVVVGNVLQEGMCREEWDRFLDCRIKIKENESFSTLFNLPLLYLSLSLGYTRHKI